MLSWAKALVIKKKVFIYIIYIYFLFCALIDWFESCVVYFVNSWTSFNLGNGIADKLDQRLHEYLQNGGGLLFGYVMLLLKDFGEVFRSRSFLRGILSHFNPTGNYMLQVNNRNTRARCDICSKVTIKTRERRHWRHSGVFIVKYISHLFLVFLLLALSR